MSRDAVNLLWFAGWSVALVALFLLGLRLPLMTRLRRPGAAAYTWSIVVVVGGVVVLANMALFRHDVNIDLTRERTFTPSRAAAEVVETLDRDVQLTYFYQARDEAGRRGKYVVEALARRSPHLQVRTVDPDRQPRLAETYGVRLYNAAVIEAEGRRVQVMGSDENDFALGIQRVLRQRRTTVCFAEGHGEYPFDNFEFHTHLESAASHSHGDKSSAFVQMPGHGAGRLRRALEALGLETRKIVPATLTAIPRECTVVASINPRTAYLPAESDLLAAYLADGGSALLLYDLGFVVERRLAGLLERLGLRVDQEVVVDPRDHFSTDYETVAVPVYEPHPITTRVALTFYPGVRPITLLPRPAGVTVTPLVLSSRESFSRPVAAVGADAVVRAAAGVPGSSTTGRPGPHVLAAAVEGRWSEAAAGAPTFRLVVVGDGDFASNSFLPYMANGDLALSMVRWLIREDKAPKARPMMPVPPMVLLTAGQMQRLFVLIEMLLPFTVVAVGMVVWWRRR
jgi:gliding motility-associatede transport system auxiliary component